MIISYSTADGGRSRAWTAREHADDIAPLGTLIIDGRTSEIMYISTHPKHRRKGIATALRAAAVADGFPPVHSPFRTPEGDAWARSTGDPLPTAILFAKA